MSRSNVEVEYHDVVNIVSKCNLLLELHCPILKATLVDCDNIIELYMFRNLVWHQTPSTLRLILILFAKKLLVIKFAYFMFHLNISLQIYSPMIFLLFCFKIFRDSLNIHERSTSIARVYNNNNNNNNNIYNIYNIYKIIFYSCIHCEYFILAVFIIV